MSSITHLLKYLLSPTYRQQARVEECHRRITQAIEDYVDALPQCHGWILLASRADKEDGFYCDVTIRTRDFLSWARQNADEHVIQNFQAEVVRKALPVWLSRASFDERTVSLLPPGAFREIAEDIDDWVTQGRARVFCSQCQAVPTEIDVTKENYHRAGNAYSWWTDVWTCENGHVLRKKDQHMRLILRRNRL